MGGNSDGLGGEIALRIMGITVKLETMAAEDLSKWERVEQGYSIIFQRGPDKRTFPQAKVRNIIMSI